MRALRKVAYEYHIVTLVSKSPWPAAGNVGENSVAVPIPKNVAGAADPFLVTRGGRHFLFMELIGKATSTGTARTGPSPR